MLAVTYTGAEHRREYTLPAGLQERGLQGIGGANLHALAAPDTALKEIFLYQRSGRANIRMLPGKTLSAPDDRKCSQSGDTCNYSPASG